MALYHDQIAAAARKLNVSLSESHIAQLLEYHGLLMKWNKAYNLTAVRDPQEMIHRHVVDSMTIIPHITGHHLLDVGCGAGLPGLVIAIARPELQVTLLDANGKKTRFCQQVKTELKLDNVTVVHSRLEDYAPEVKHDGITSRAFTTLRDMTEKSVSCCALGGYYFAMKGIYPTEELAELPPSIETTQVIPIDALGQSGQRHLVVLKQKA
jgi:16S rRNA (guanine527-N7)-methyltransferase